MPVDSARVDKIREDLNAVLKGRIDIHAALEKHKEKWKRKKKTSIPVPLKIE